MPVKRIPKSLLRTSLTYLLIASLLPSLFMAISSFLILEKVQSGSYATTLLGAARAFTVLPENEQRLAAAASGYRLTVISNGGKVLLETSPGADTRTMENHANRPEIIAALAGKPGISRRRSVSTGEAYLYVAIPIQESTKILRLAAPLPDLLASLRPFQASFGFMTVLALTVASLTSVRFSKNLALPMEQISRMAQSKLQEARALEFPESRPDFTEIKHSIEKSLHHGETETTQIRVKTQAPPLPRELSALKDSLEGMALGMKNLYDEARNQAIRFAIILDSMGEAVVALDRNLSILSINPAAIRLARTQGKNPVGTKILETLRPAELENIAATTLETGIGKKVDIHLHGSTEQWIRVHATAIPDTENSTRPRGVVLVISDISELRRLEQIRTEFVANVSHELRTPIQLVKGYTEELLQADPADKEKNIKFLNIVSRNADRMSNIVSDLLSLARLEQEGTEWMLKENLVATSVIKQALESIQPLLEERDSKVSISVEPWIRIHANPGLLEQVIVNLVSNAARYAPAGSPILITAREQDEQTIIGIEDRGPGIPPADIPHIFERFYRVDRSRSRQSGGTGLGLAIVRHIALVHGGTVQVQNRAAGGAVFEFLIPRMHHDDGTGFLHREDKNA